MIGIHSGSVKNIKNEYRYNIGTTFTSILENIKDMINKAKIKW